MVFYSATVRTLTEISAAPTITSTYLLSNSPIFALVTSSIVFCGWMIQFNVWMYGEISAPNYLEHPVSWCPNANSFINGAGMAKHWISIAVLVTILAYLTLATMAVPRGRKTSKRNFAGQELVDTQTLMQSWACDDERRALGQRRWTVRAAFVPPVLEGPSGIIE